MSEATRQVRSAPRRVQRVPERWPVLHLEAELPSWSGLTVDGCVPSPRDFDLAALARLGAGEHRLSLHCVWGWSRPEVRWWGLGLGRLLDDVGVEPEATHVVFASSSGTYSSCLPLADAASGVLAWRRDDELLEADAGGPLRYVGPPTYWGYKGVKWASQVSLVDRFIPGFWESKVGDPVGRIPKELELP